MILKRFSATWESTIRSNNFLLVSNTCLVILTAILITLLLSRHERLVLVPPHLDSKMEVSWNSANEGYYKSFGMYVATLIGSVTPRTVKFVANSLGDFMAPPIYSKVRAQILSLANSPTFMHATSTNFFRPDSIVYEASTSRVFVLGKLVNAGFQEVADSEKPVIYEMRIRMHDGRPQITGFTSYSGTQAHTLKWLNNQSAAVRSKANTVLPPSSYGGSSKQ